MKVYEYILSERERRPLHFTLIDPDKVDLDAVERLARRIEEAGSDAVLVGGSVGVTTELLDSTIAEVKRIVGVPVIIFPGSICQISKSADAILFLSLLNSADPYYIIGAQVQAAPMLARRFPRLEVISTAYLVVGDGGTAGYMGWARPIPYDRVEVLTSYVLAAHYIGFKSIYLEAGSGAASPIPPRAVKAARAATDRVLIVGGGIRSGAIAREIAEAGADVVVTGTVFEEDPEKLPEIVRAVKSVSRTSARTSPLQTQSK